MSVCAALPGAHLPVRTIHIRDPENLNKMRRFGCGQRGKFASRGSFCFLFALAATLDRKEVPRYQFYLSHIPVE